MTVGSKSRNMLGREISKSTVVLAILASLKHDMVPFRSPIEFLYQL